jgi:VCBS repeat-containing protein
MADIVGTPNPDILDGTGDPDVINGLAGNDTISGNGGDDVINGGSGTDTISGGEGDDTFIYDLLTIGGDILDGGAGTDTIELRPSAQLILTNLGLTSAYLFNLQPQPITSVERLHFASNVGDTILVQFNWSQFAASGITQVIGGAGRDILAFAITGPGSYTLTGLTFINWSAAPLNAWEGSGDFVALSGSGSSGVTLTATDGLNVFQTLSGTNGNDILNGSSNADVLNGQGGSDSLIGNAGNDSLAIINQSFGPNPPTNFNGAGGLYDGGEGTDVLTIGGYVNFLGTLQNIEGVNLLPASTTGNFSQVAGIFQLDSAHLAMLPTNTFFTGTGTVLIDGSPGANFDGSQYTFTPGSNVSFEIYGGDGDGLSFTGTSNGDFIKFGAGLQTATGGGGADLFQVGQGTGTVTDFVQGTDLIDLTPTGITGLGRLADFLSQGPSGARIAGDSSGVHFELNIAGITAASLTAADFVFDPGNRPVFNFGTALDDILFGYSLNDQLFGGDGNDRIYTGGGRDIVNAGNGDDTIVVDGQIGFGSGFDGGAGSDRVVVRASAITIFNGIEPLVSFASGQFLGIETVQFDTKPGERIFVVVTNAQVSGVSTVVGGDGTDFFIVSANGNASNIYTIPVLNLINWGPDDLLSISVGGGSANTTLNSIAHSGRYVLNGGNGNDILNGSSGIEILRGNAGDDTIVSGGGADFVDGGSGTDTALFAGSRASYSVTTGANGNVLIDGASYTSIEFFRFADGKYLWNGVQLVRDNRPPVANSDSVAVNEDASVLGNVLGNDSTGESDPAADHIVVTSVSGIAVGAATVIQGAYGKLTIAASGTFSYVADADILDALPAGAHLTESFSYSIADDFGATAASTLTINLTTVADLVSVTLGNGNAVFTGTGADEVIIGGRGNDTIRGLAGSDRIYGGSGADQLLGGDGWDLLVGGNGADRLSGDAGNDVLIGGKGADILSGGTGADVFDFGALGTDQDTILDFEIGIDRIHLSDGVTITGLHQNGGSTVLDLSSGGSILLSGVTGLIDASALLTPDLPDWTVGLPLI